MSLLGKIITGTVLTSFLVGGGLGLSYLGKKRIKEMNEYNSWIDSPAKMGKAVIGKDYKTLWGIAAAMRPKDTDSTYGIDINNFLIIMNRCNPHIKNYTVHDGDTVYYPIYDTLEKQKANFRDFISSIYKTKKNRK